ncbi:MAG: leucine-rich repeat domain-containing protein, partial [Christensenellales bacterium]
MKKFINNSINKKQNATLMALIIGVIVMLAITTALSFAYFTSSKQSGEQALTFGVLEIDDTANGLGGFSVSSDLCHAKMVPGCTVKLGGVIKLSTDSTVDAFVRMKPTVSITLSSGTANATQKNKFVDLFNDAISTASSSAWLKSNSNDGYLYYAGKFSNTATGTNITDEFNLADASFKLDVTEFGNEWQGATVTIKLTVQALQSSHVGIDDFSVYATNQLLVNAIAGVKVSEAEDAERIWSSVFVEEVEPVFEEVINLSFTNTTPSSESTSLNNDNIKALNEVGADDVNLMAENGNTVSVGGVSSDVTKEDVDIPAYVKYDAITNKWYKCTNKDLSTEYVTNTDIYKVTTINSNAFDGYDGITNITIPSSITSIGKYAFRNCKALTEINYNATSCADLADINYVFSYAGQSGEGVKVNIGANVQKIPAYLFYPSYGHNPKITSVVFAEGSVCESIGSDAFYNCGSITSINIPDKVISIGNYAFQSCSSLTSITIGNGVKNIGNQAFSYCSALTSITIPNSVTSIESSAFKGCSNLTSIVVESGNTVYDNRDNCNAIIESGTNTLILGCNNTAIPKSVTSIGDYAFYYCSKLTSITIPEGVTSIGSNAFYNCGSITSITIPNSVTSIGSNAFYNCGSITS